MKYYEIWWGDSEGVLFPVSSRTKSNRYMFEESTSGKPMKKIKRFRASSWEEAKKVYEKFFENIDINMRWNNE